jgi:hypothetical protein
MPNRQNVDPLDIDGIKYRVHSECHLPHFSPRGGYVKNDRMPFRKLMERLNRGLQSRAPMLSTLRSVLPNVQISLFDVPTRLLR